MDKKAFFRVKIISLVGDVLVTSHHVPSVQEPVSPLGSAWHKHVSWREKVLKQQAARGYEAVSRGAAGWRSRTPPSGLTHCADFLEVRTALHVVLAVIVTVAGGISRIPFPTSPCTA